MLSQVAYFEHVASALGVFFKPLQNEFGWSRTSLGGVQTTGRLVEGLAATFTGPLVDRYGARMLMPIGGTIVALSMLALTQATHLWQLYLFKGFLAGVGYTLMGDLVTGVSISKWFVKKRGRAQGYSRAASDASGMILLPLLVYTISGQGWRTGFVLFAALAIVFPVVPPLLLMRRSPEDLGLRPDGLNPNDTGRSADSKPEGSKEDRSHSGPEPVWNISEVMRTKEFWMIAGVFSVSAMAWQGINVSLPSHIQDLGYNSAALSAILSINFIVQTIAAFLMGYIAEYSHWSGIRTAPLILLGLGTYCFTLGKYPVLLWLAAVLFRAGLAGTLVMQEVVWANYFGRRSLGVVRSVGNVVVYVPGAIGPMVVNMAYDIAGSYTVAFVAMAILIGLAALVLAVVRHPTAKRYLKPELFIATAT
jgi:sugar phosphate permease